MSGSALSGPEKAVLMLLSLDESVAEPIVRQLSPDRVKQLRQTASRMKTIPAQALQSVYLEFIEDSAEVGMVPEGVMDFIRRVSTRALGEPMTREIFEEGQPRTSLQKIASAELSVLAGLLRNEDPQLVAALLSQLPSESSANLLEKLPEEMRPAVLTRMGALRSIPGDLVAEIADAIAAELPDTNLTDTIEVDGIAQSAQVVRSLSKETCELLLGDVEADNEELAKEIRQAMYSFEDLNALDARGMRELLKSVPGDRLTLALKTASSDIATLIYSGMSKRAADRLREDLGLLGSVRLSDVEEAQQEIVDIALRLQSEGQLSLGDGGGDLV